MHGNYYLQYTQLYYLHTIMKTGPCPLYVQLIHIFSFLIFHIILMLATAMRPETVVVFSIVENKLYSYADDSTLVVVVPSPVERVAVSESMNRDLNRVSVWCNLWGMKLNASKTKIMIVPMSRTVHPQLNPLTLDGTVRRESADLVIL